MSSSKRAYEAHAEAMQPAPDYPVCPDNKLADKRPTFQDKAALTAIVRSGTKAAKKPGYVTRLEDALIIYLNAGHKAARTKAATNAKRALGIPQKPKESEAGE